MKEMSFVGDLGRYLRPFETDLTVELKTGVSEDDGYVTEDLATSVEFKGAIIPISTFMMTKLGVHDKGDSILYVRMSQEDYPALSAEDIVTDANANKWKITREADYDHVGDIKLFFVMRVFT